MDHAGDGRRRTGATAGGGCGAARMDWWRRQRRPLPFSVPLSVSSSLSGRSEERVGFAGAQPRSPAEAEEGQEESR